MMRRGPFSFLILLLILLVAVPIYAEKLLLDADFETGDLSGWRATGDVCIAPSFCAGQPSGKYWLGMSTNQANDPITLCGASSIHGVQTVLRSPNLLLPFKPERIRVDFTLKFLTNEDPVSDLGTDTVTVRLLTKAGPIVIASFDDSGSSPDSKNLTIRGNGKFQESACNPTWKYESRLLHVSYYRTFREPVTSAMMSGPIALEFALSNQFDTDFDSAIVVDDIQVRVDSEKR